MNYLLSDTDRTFTGETFSGDLYARAIHPDGKSYHTFRTATVLVDGSGLVFEGCTFENTAGSGKEKGQAIALYLDGDDITLQNCIIRGHQDTLFLAPLPIREHEKDGFIGPKKDEPRTRRVFHIKNCVIEGSVDFVFGGATAYFDDCTFISNESGYVFAPSTPQDVKEGFVARNCRFLRTGTVEDESVYIARPWRRYGKVRLQNCYLDSHISKVGFDDWGDESRRSTVVFEEYGSYGPGSEGARRPSWVRHDLEG
ncbi:MAG: pectin methylesterase [Clostridiales bacterium]|nr:pectin methylesterase [Clostridiales bacterium]